MEWHIRGRKFLLDTETDDVQKRMEQAFSDMETTEGRILSEYCAMFRKLFTNIFGKKKSRRIFQNLPENPRIYHEIYLSFLRAVQAERLEKGAKSGKRKKHRC